MEDRLSLAGTVPAAGGRLSFPDSAFATESRRWWCEGSLALGRTPPVACAPASPDAAVVAALVASARGLRVACSEMLRRSAASRGSVFCSVAPTQPSADLVSASRSARTRRRISAWVPSRDCLPESGDGGSARASSGDCSAGCEGCISVCVSVRGRSLVTGGGVGTAEPAASRRASNSAVIWLSARARGTRGTETGLGFAASRGGAPGFDATDCGCGTWTVASSWGSTRRVLAGAGAADALAGLCPLPEPSIWACGT